MSRMNCLKKRKGMPLYFNHQPPPQQIYYWSISNVRKKIKRRGEKPDIGDEPVSKKQKMTEMKIEPKTWPRTLSNESLSEIVSLSGSANTNWNKLKHYVKHILWVFMKEIDINMLYKHYFSVVPFAFDAERSWFCRREVLDKWY